MKAALKQQNIGASDIRPYRLLMSLLDKPDVGPLILDDILYEVFRTLYLSCLEDKPEGVKTKQEILKSANLLFSSLEPWYIWLYTGSLFDQACKVNIEELTTILEIETTSTAVKQVGSDFPNIWEVCELCEFLLRVIPLEVGGDTTSEFLLNLILHLITQLTKYIETLSPQQIARTLKTCTIILSKIQPLNKSSKAKTEEKPPENELVNAGVIRSRVASEIPEVETKIEETTKEVSQKETKINIAAINRFSAVFKNFLKQYEIFYVTLVGGGRILNNQLVPEAFESMKKGLEVKNENDYAKELRRILTAVMNDDDTSEVFAVRKNANGWEKFSLEVAVEDNEKWEEAFRIASEIIVDLSSFPVHRVDIDLSQNTTFFPWMKFVIVCACWLEKSPNLQLTAIKTLLSLLTLSKAPPKTHGVITLLNSSQAEFLENNTHVIEVPIS